MTDTRAAHSPDPARYDSMLYRRCGRTGLDLPAVSLGLWQNFGDGQDPDVARQIILRAFDLGITHFDLANNYGPPPGAAEERMGELIRRDLFDHRDELVIASKAGYRMWPGPYGEWGSRKHVLSSLDQSLARLGLDYVDVFYSHRADESTPLEETMGALATAVTSGKALYAGVSSYSPSRTRAAARILGELGVPLVVHQPSYSMLNRWIEDELLDTLDDLGMGCVGFSPLSQGLLTARYITGVPEGSRASQGETLHADQVTPELRSALAALDVVARERGQSLAQLAVAWALRDPRVTSLVVGASRVQQLEDTVAALARSTFDDEELRLVDAATTGWAIDPWAHSSAVS